jgi:UDP-N-acetylglucosamine--N-acetylmuramyl-(pentapeptide) pyrophosphoryl-undecaprenol N-acetylglucosamine transferase
VYPALAVAERLGAGPDEVLYVGTPNGLEARLVASAGIPFRAIEAAGYDRARPITLLTSVFTLVASSVKALGVLAKFRPQVVIGFGGYVSIPVALAAILRGIPLVLHEQNSVPGMANRFLARWAAAVGVTYEESSARFPRTTRIDVTGNPVRADVLSADREKGRAALGVSAKDTVLLVFGGSRGARHLNTALVAIRDKLLAISNLRVVHVAGAAEATAVRTALESAGAGEGRWDVLEYIEDMGTMLAASDLVLARAGATSIAEITALGLPSVLVPYPYATDDHQTRNAMTAVDRGAAVLVADSELDSRRFPDAVVGLLGDPGLRATMAAASHALGRPDAADRVVRLAREVAGEVGPHARSKD